MRIDGPENRDRWWRRNTTVPAIFGKSSFVLAVVVLLGVKLVNAQEAVTAKPDAVLIVMLHGSFQEDALRAMGTA